MIKLVKILIPLAILVILIGGGLYYQDQASLASIPDPRNVPEGWQVYKDKRGEYSVAYPEGFFVATSGSERSPTGWVKFSDRKDIMVQIQEKEKDIIVSDMILRIGVVKNEKNLSLQEWLKDVGLTAQNFGFGVTFQDVDVSETSGVRMISRSGSWVAVWISKGNKIFHIKQNIIEDTNRGFNPTDEDIKEYLGIFDQFLESFTLK